MGYEGITNSAQKGLAKGVALSNGVIMPWLGLGVYQMGSQEETEMVVKSAIDRGYRLIDTAAVYGNETGTGAAVRNCGIAREEVFVTTKVWNDDIRAGRIEAALDESLEKLGTNYVDLYLLHWPIDGRIAEAWRALEKCYREGRVRAIGVSNYLEHHLDELMENCAVPPMVNQIEYHPYLQSAGLKSYCDERNIRLQAWSPFMHGGEILQDSVLTQIGSRHGKTSAQVIVRWILQSGVTTIPKSSRIERLVENSDIFDFELSVDEMSAILGLDRNQRSGPNPDDFDF